MLFSFPHRTNLIFSVFQSLLANVIYLNDALLQFQQWIFLYLLLLIIKYSFKNL